MGNTCSRSDQAQFRVRGVNTAEEQLAEVDLETALLDFDEADPLSTDRFTDEVGPALKADAAPLVCG